jgi:hypothetical protein
MVGRNFLIFYTLCMINQENGFINKDLTVLLWDLDGDLFHFGVVVQPILSKFSSESGLKTGRNRIIIGKKGKVNSKLANSWLGIKT